MTSQLNHGHFCMFFFNSLFFIVWEWSTVLISDYHIKQLNSIQMKQMSYVFSQFSILLYIHTFIHTYVHEWSYVINTAAKLYWRTEGTRWKDKKGLWKEKREGRGLKGICSMYSAYIWQCKSYMTELVINKQESPAHFGVLMSPNG